MPRGRSMSGGLATRTRSRRGLQPGQRRVSPTPQPQPYVPNQAQGTRYVPEALGGQTSAPAAQPATQMPNVGPIDFSGFSATPGQAVLDAWAGAAPMYQDAWKRMADPVLAGYRERETGAMAELDKLGGQQRRDLRTRYATARRSAGADLTSRGLGGSTAVQNARLGLMGAENQDTRRLDDQLTRERLDYSTRLSGDRLGAESGLGTAGFEATVRHPNDQYLRALDSATREGINRTQQVDLMTQLQNQNMAFAPFLQDVALTDPMMALALQTQIQAMQSPAMALGQSLAGTYMQPQASVPGPDYGTAAIGAGGSILSAIPMAMAMASDVEAKESFSVVDGQDTLEKLRILDVKRWRYKDVMQPGGDHVGPMAQDFKRRFGLGDDDKSINMVDAIGVLIASVQALADRVEQLEEKLDGR